jgi:RNA polymerase sigma-70 factor (ECF subfamily)
VTDEHIWLQQAQNGNHDAFDNLYNSLYPVVRRYVVRMIGEQDSVEDILQLTFIALHRNIQRVNPAETLRPYVYRIARNRCIDELRQQGRYDPLDDEDRVRVSFTANEPPKPEDTVHWMLVRLEVMIAIDNLPQLQREALILFAEEGLSLKEIAEVVNVSVGTVKSRIYHARQSLKRMLHPHTLQAVGTLFK